MKKITVTLCSLFVLLVSSLSESAVNSKEQNFTQSLASGALNVTTTFSTTDAGFLSVVSLRFSAAPASAETIKVYRDSRAGANFDTLLSSYTTIAGSTTEVTFVIGNAVPIAETDQVRVTCTNVSLATTVYTSVVLDTAPRGSAGVSVYDNGTLKISSLSHDYHWHFGDVIPDANQVFGAYYSELSQMAVPSNPASGTRRLFTDSGTGELSVRTSAGNTVSLENGGAGSTQSFVTWDAPAGTNPVADTTTDTITITETSPLVITGNATTDTLDITWTPLTVPEGGTGVTTTTDGGLLIGKGVAAVSTTGVLADGTTVIGDGVTDPTTVPLLSSSTGTVVAARFPALTGDVTTTAGSLATSVAPDAVALTTDTTGNYVASANTSALTGLTGGSAGSEGAALSLAWDYSATLAGDPALGTGVCVPASTGLLCEGATANTFETLITVTDPTADRTFTIPNADSSGVQALTCGANNAVTAISGAGLPTCTLEADHTLTNDGAVTIGSGAVNPTVLTFNSDAGVDGTLRYDGAGDTFAVDQSTHVNKGMLVGPVTAMSGVQGEGWLNLSVNGGAGFTTTMYAAGGTSAFRALTCGGTSLDACTATPSDTGFVLDSWLYTGSAWGLGARLLLLSEGAASANNTPGQIVFRTNPGAGEVTRMTINKNGTVGIGTATVNSDSRLEVRGHLTTEGTAPTLSSCGTSPSIVGTDTAGTVTVGTGSATSCTVTFALAYTNAPVCVANRQTAGAAKVSAIRTPTTTTTLTLSELDPSDVIHYICIGRG